jgi:hypothetical protein
MSIKATMLLVLKRYSEEINFQHISLKKFFQIYNEAYNIVLDTQCEYAKVINKEHFCHKCIGKIESLNNFLKLQEITLRIMLETLSLCTEEYDKKFIYQFKLLLIYFQFQTIKTLIENLEVNNKESLNFFYKCQKSFTFITFDINSNVTFNYFINNICIYKNWDNFKQISDASALHLLQYNFIATSNTLILKDYWKQIFEIFASTNGKQFLNKMYDVIEKHKKSSEIIDKIKEL